MGDGNRFGGGPSRCSEAAAEAERHPGFLRLDVAGRDARTVVEEALVDPLGSEFRVQRPEDLEGVFAVRERVPFDWNGNRVRRDEVRGKVSRRKHHSLAEEEADGDAVALGDESIRPWV